MLSWNEIVQKYIIKYSNLIGKATRPLHDHFNIEYFTYHKIDTHGKYTVLVDRPNWAEHYVSSQIYLNDPYLRHPSVYKSGFCLVDSHGTEEYQERLMRSGKEVLDVDLGVLLIQRTDNEVEFFGFAANKQRSALQNLHLNHPQLLHSFARHFKNEMGGLLKKMDQEAGSLVELKGKDFLSDLPVHPPISPEIRAAFYKEMGLVKAEKLTRRERQCLRHLVEEKTAKETAALLGLKSRTIEFYFENIKNKLSCSSKQEVLKIARELHESGIFNI